MTISRPEELPSILNSVHDCWFDVERLAFNPAGRTVRILLSEKRPRQDRPFDVDSILTIREVSDLVVVDPEQVQFYDLNEIEYLPERGMLVITGGIPITIQMLVDGLLIDFDKPISPVKA